MTLDEALARLAEKPDVRFVSASLSVGSVLKYVPNGWQEPKLMIVFEKTGDSYAFQNSADDQAADWFEITGWASYA